MGQAECRSCMTRKALLSQRIALSASLSRQKTSFWLQHSRRQPFVTLAGTANKTPAKLAAEPRVHTILLRSRQLIGVILSLSSNAVARNVVPCVFHAVRHVVRHVFHAGSSAAPDAVPCQWSGPRHLIWLVPWRTLQGRISPPIPAEKVPFDERYLPIR